MKSTIPTYGVETLCAVYAECRILDTTQAMARTKSSRVVPGVGLPATITGNTLRAFMNKTQGLKLISKTTKIKITQAGSDPFGIRTSFACSISHRMVSGSPS